MKTALITGGAGFVGSYLIDELTDNQIEVSITKLKGEPFDNIKVRAVYNLDITNPVQIEDVLNASTPDYIFHLAAQSSVAKSWSEPAETMSINAIGTINLLEAVRKIDKKVRILLVGSGEEYGFVKPDEVPVSETNLLRPGNIYAASKAVQGMIGQIYSRAYGMEIIMVRAFNHIGPGQSPMFVVADFAKQIAEIEKGLAEPVMRVGNLEAKRDFTDVRDVVRGYRLLIEQGKTGEYYNIGSGKSVAIRDMLNELLSMSDVKIELHQAQDKVRPLDAPVIEADIQKIVIDIGWKQEISMKLSLIDTLQCWRRIINERISDG